MQSETRCNGHSEGAVAEANSGVLLASAPNPSSDLVCDIFSDIMTLAEAPPAPLSATKCGPAAVSTAAVALKRRKRSPAAAAPADSERLTFPQIWVESFCESSCGEDDDRVEESGDGVEGDADAEGEHLLRRQRRDSHKSRRRRPPASMTKSTGGSRSKEVVLRSLQLASCCSTDADVSFEGSSLSASSCSDLASGAISGSRQSSFQMSTRDNSIEFAECPPLPGPATEAHTVGTLDNGNESDLVDDREFRTPLAAFVQEWLCEMEAHGVDVRTLQSFAKDDVEEEEDDTWFETCLVRVFDPYYDLDPNDISSVEGRTDPKTGLPVGRCTVVLKNGDEMFGTFHGGLRQGRGSIEGSNLQEHGVLTVKGYYRDSVLMGLGMAILAPGKMWETHAGRIHLEGVFNDGYLEGPVRGMDETGGLVFVGQYRRGVPSGHCWLAKEGQGWICGAVDERGRFTGNDIAFVYPDRTTCLLGRFEDEVMVEATCARLVGATKNDAAVLVPSIKECATGDESEATSASFSFSPSDSKRIACDHTVRDPYESAVVECRQSEIECAGDGLFAAMDLPAGVIVAYYNGLRVQYDERYSPLNANYQIYVDWRNTDRSPYIDIPTECIDSQRYCASLADKANHSFDSNCQFVAVYHPRFGRIPGLKTLRPVPRGDELLTHYKYDMALAPNWYTEAWQRFSTSGDGEDA